jgi:hypothetical protein
MLTTTGISDTRPLRVTFGINETLYRLDATGRILGKGDLFNWPDADGKPGYSWVETLGYLEIFHWYDVIWEPFPFGGGVMHEPLPRVTLGRRDLGDLEDAQDTQ